VSRPPSDAEARPLDDILIVDDDSASGGAARRGRSLVLLRGRRDPVVAVTLLKTLGVAFGVLLVLIGVGAVVVAAVEFEGWALWAGTLGGVLIIFLGAIVALVQVALAHLVDTAHQALERLSDLNVPAGRDSPATRKRQVEQVALLREIRDAVQLTDDEKRIRLAERAGEAIRALVETVETHVADGDFEAAREALAELARQHPEAAETGDLAQRVDEAEAAAREAALQDLVENVNASLTAQAWDQAAALSEELLQRFPGEQRAVELHETVRRRYDEATADERRRLYRRITDLAREQHWREAFDLTSDLVERFPESEEAARLRPRIGALSHKAELGERHRLLATVREETRRQRWPEAYAAARDLVNTYPDSEEAAEVFRDLPNLRRLARRT